MPEKNGFEATAEILNLLKTHGRSDECRVVALTSFHDQDTINKCLEIGFTEFQNKPLSDT